MSTRKCARANVHLRIYPSLACGTTVEYSRKNMSFDSRYPNKGSFSFYAQTNATEHFDLPAGCLLGPNMLRTHLPRQNPQTVTGFAYAAYYGARNGVNPSPSADPLLETRGPMLRAWGAPSWTVRPPSDVPARARVPCSVPPWGNSQNNTGLTRCSENSTGILLIHLIALLLPHEAMKPHASYIPSSCTKIKD